MHQLFARRARRVTHGVRVGARACFATHAGSEARVHPSRMPRYAELLEQLSQVVTERAELPRDLMTAEPPKHGKKRRRTVEAFQREIAAKQKNAGAAP